MRKRITFEPFLGAGLLCLASCTGGPLHRATPELEQVDNRDGTWSYALDPTFDPGQPLVESRITWGYAGQARHSIAPAPPFGMLSYTRQNKPPLTASEKNMAMERADSRGRLWRPLSVSSVTDASDDVRGQRQVDSPPSVDQAPPVAPSPAAGETTAVSIMDSH
jgi:hypothetical protein